MTYITERFSCSITVSFDGDHTRIMQLKIAMWFVGPMMLRFTFGAGCCLQGLSVVSDDFAA